MNAETKERPHVVFSLDERRYALPLDRVRRSIRVVAVIPLPDTPAIVLGIIDLGGEVVPVIDVRKCFKHPPREIRLSDHLVIAHTGRRAVALLVDETNGMIDVAPGRYSRADEILPRMALIDGVVRLEDGLILIHDLDRLLSLEEDAAIDHALSARDGARP